VTRNAASAPENVAGGFSRPVTREELIAAGLLITKESALPSGRLLEEEGPNFLSDIPRWNATEGEVEPASDIVPQTRLKELLATIPGASKTSFVKNVPIAVYPLSASSLASMPSLILEEMGGLDKANYPNKDEYLRANFGGAMSLQVAHGKLDAYPIPPGQYASNYKAVPLEEMVSKNPKNAAALSEILGDLRSIAGVCGALKTVPTEMVLASDLGFPVGRLLKIEAPWGGDQTKDAGKEAYLVACEKPYLINLDESGLPVAYIKASDAQQANPLDDPKARVAADWDLAHQMLGAPNARVPREVFLEVCLGKWDFPAGSPDLNYYQEYLNYLFDTATALMLPSQKTDLGKHCFGYATLLAMEFYMGGTPADSLALKADSKPSDRLATVRDELDADWASVPKDVDW
jgi:hypothetical protein